jgi:aryl-alcohol dehydrogenase-like predicted oxidoreductase
MRLAIGTVQFGLNYGISNTTGRTPLDEVARILIMAKNEGIDTLDTAAAYGESEKVLGEVGVENWKVVSKVPPLPENTSDGKEWVLRHVRRSLERLRVGRLDGLLLHNSTDILKVQGANIAAGLQEAKACGLAAKVGYSIYSPQQLPELLGTMRPDLIQTPFNIFDQRLTKSGWLGRLVDAGVEIHARSVFLQGLLLMEKEKRPSYFERWSSLWEKWDTLVNQHGALPLCLGFVKAYPSISRVVVGVENPRHFEQLLAIWNDIEAVESSALSCDDPLLIEASNWNIK